VSKKSDVAVETPYRIKLVITIFANLFIQQYIILYGDNDPVERIASRGLLIPEILIMIKQIINAFYKIPDFVYWNVIKRHILNMDPYLILLSLPTLFFLLRNL
jgi:hypothetical protein